MRQFLTFVTRGSGLLLLKNFLDSGVAELVELHVERLAGGRDAGISDAHGMCELGIGEAAPIITRHACKQANEIDEDARSISGVGNDVAADRDVGDAVQTRDPYRRDDRAISHDGCENAHDCKHVATRPDMKNCFGLSGKRHTVGQFCNGIGYASPDR